MTGLDWTVIASGALAALWVIRYFLFSQSPAVAAAVVAGIQELAITVKGGYEPRTVRASAGSPVRLVFDRQETSGCSEEVVFGDFGVRRFLPAFQKTPIELGAVQPGTYEFTCGMGMLRGKLIVT